MELHMLNATHMSHAEMGTYQSKAEGIVTDYVEVLVHVGYLSSPGTGSAANIP
jgi:hypothetical protein